MKATGIVRRIDDLGRVIIPKEIRRTLGIEEGDPLEIFTENGGVCFVPYRTDVETVLKSALVQIESIDWERAQQLEAFFKENKLI